MQHVISILGTTASGKTSLALEVARYAVDQSRSISDKLPKTLVSELAQSSFSGVELISADSRQVYRSVQIISGADIPQQMYGERSNLYEYDFYTTQDEKMRLHGVGILEKDADWSVSHFKNFAVPIILRAWESNYLPIIVGGTGLYHQQIFTTDSDLNIPPDKVLRRRAESVSVVQLQDLLRSTNPKKLAAMNHSDQQNPRRLVRAIEVSRGTSEASKSAMLPSDTEFKHTQIGLKFPLTELESRIAQRVGQRLDAGAVDESRALQSFCSKDYPICKTLGLPDLFEYLAGKTTIDECKQNWTLHEFQYAKRQLTWFQKNPDIIWLD